MNTLTFTSLFPNSAQPHQGLFVAKRLQELVSSYPITTTVVAPVPWFPSASGPLSAYSNFAKVPKREQHRGFDVYHPRYLVVPKCSWRVSPHLMYLGVRRLVERIHANDPFDMIDAHFFYPDGVTAVLLGKQLDIPVCITARGSDINLMSKHSLPRRYIKWAAENADGLITVSNALKDALIDLEVPKEKITVLRNGVDLELFKPLDRKRARSKLGMDGINFISVGNLVELKGHDLAIRALLDLPSVTLWIVGEGPLKRQLEDLSIKYGVERRVVFAGAVPQMELPTYYSAADGLILASSREGWANVLLESLACGTPVVATRVGGTPEVIADPIAGVLMEERSPAALSKACQTLLSDYPDHQLVRNYAEKFDWQATSTGQYSLFDSILSGRRSG